MDLFGSLRSKLVPARAIDGMQEEGENINRMRVFPRIFIGMYIYLLWRVTEWFMLLPDPNTQQASLVSVLVGTGASIYNMINGNIRVYSGISSAP